MDSKDVRLEIKAIVNAIKNDEGYQNVWVANLTMATYDELIKAIPEIPFELAKNISNNSARRFLSWFTAGAE